MSDESSSFSWSWDILPIQLVNASDIRALNTVNQPGTLPNRRRMSRYSSFSSGPFGLSTGARYGPICTGSAG